MALNEEIYQTLEEQRIIVLSFNDVPILEAAKQIAFYSAMIDAAIDDPMDIAEDQEEIIDYLGENLQEHVENYQRLINAKM